MKKTVLLLYLLLTAVLATATFVEYAHGSAFVTTHIYHSIPFMVLWGVLTVLMVAGVCKARMWQRWPSFLLHLSFVVILAGALTSYLTSRKGMLHLRGHEPVFQYVETESRRTLNLPFALALDTFYVQYYPGTDAPADYVSRVSIVEKIFGQELGYLLPSLGRGKGESLLTISMNNVLDHGGYRFYQSSYDEDGQGSWLSVNYDPWGTGITYAGYLLLCIAVVGMLCSKRGGFRRLLRHPLLKRTGSMLAVLLLCTVAYGQGATKRLTIIPRAEADSMATKQVIYHDRVVPLHTLARDFVKKLYGKERFSGLSPEQILLSWQRHPEEWAYVPAIKIKNGELCRRLGLEGNYARMIDLFSSDGKGAADYRLRAWWQQGETEGKPSALQKAILETDEKVALILMLQHGTLIRPFPTDGSMKPLSVAKVRAEILYNTISFSKILFMVNLTLGFLSFFWMVYTNVFGKKRAINSSTRRLVNLSTKNLLFLSLLFHLTGYLLRWYIAGRIPLSNGYETMQFLALCILLFACLLQRRFQPAVPFGFLLSGFTLLVSYLGQMNPQITPLMPVLVSPWLSLHVSVIMISYALFAFILLDGILALCLPREAERLMVYSRLMLYPAVGLLAVGIFIGAVWANVSWGRYWGWDPKEVWALITLLLYALPLHSTSFPLFRRPRWFHLYCIFAFLSVLVTYFGVNFFLGGMHSYA